MPSSGKALIDAILKSLDKVDELRWRGKNIAIKPEAAPGRGPGSEPLTESLGTKFDVGEEGVRSKQFIDAVEEEMDRLSTQVPLDELEATAKRNVEAAFEAGSPKRKFKSIQERKKVEGGRKRAIIRGEQKYMPRGNVRYTSSYEEPPKFFKDLEHVETSVGTPSEVTDIIDEVTRTARTGKGQKVVHQDQLDDLFGDEQAKQVEAMRKQLNEQGIKRSRVPTERDRAEVLNVARDQVRLKKVDEMAKRVFDKIEDLERSLTTGKVDVRVTGARGQAAKQQVGGAAKRLRNFKKEAAQAAARARKSGDVSELTALENRLTASPKGSKPFVRTAEDPSDHSLKNPLLEELNKRATITPAGSGKKVEVTNESSFDPSAARVRGGANPPGVEFKQSSEDVLLNALIDMLNTRGQ
jgi:hypothetical protein